MYALVAPPPERVEIHLVIVGNAIPCPHCPINLLRMLINHEHLGHLQPLELNFEFQDHFYARDERIARVIA